MVRPLAALSLALVALAPLAACGEDSSAAPPTVQLRATASRSTLFNTQRTLRLRLENLGDEPVPVDSIRLASPAFAPVDPSQRDTVLPAGAGLLMPLPYGESRCDGGAGDHTLVAVVEGREVRVPLAQEPGGVVDDLHAAECTDAHIRSQVAVAFGEEWEVTAPRVAEGLLTLEGLVPGAEARVEALEGNVIFGLVAPGTRPPVLSVGAGQERDEARVVVSANRCDTHAMIESKRTFVYRATIRLGDDPPFELDVRPDEVTHEVLEGLLRACLAVTQE